MTAPASMVEKVADAILARVPKGYGMTRDEATGYARAAMAAMRGHLDRIEKWAAEPQAQIKERTDE